MKIEIRNIDVGKVVSFLEKEDFKGLKSIMRSKVTNYLSAQLQEVIEGEKVILEDYKDDKAMLEKELTAYLDQTVAVEGGNFLKPLNVVKSHIKELASEECEREFRDESAYALSILYDVFKLDEGEDVNESDDNGN